MKYFLAVILVAILLPLECGAGLFFGPNSRTVVHNYGPSGAGAYFAPAPVYYSPAPAATVVYSARAGVVSARHKTKVKSHRNKTVTKTRTTEY